MRPEAFPAKLREEAFRLRRYGAEAQAILLSTVADDLEAAFRQEEEELLNLQRAAEESGYSTAHLGRLAREGAIPNAGRSNAPRIRRGDLPRKAAGLPQDTPVLTLKDRQQVARSIITRNAER